MTTGHKHRTVKVTVDGHLHRVLTTPIFWSFNIARVDASPYPYGEGVNTRLDYKHRAGWYLSALSILHRWTGLTLEAKK